jgi:hypothetical protein
MTILKRALVGAFLGSLRIAVFASLKLGLFVYAFSLSDTAFATAAAEGTGCVAASDSHASSIANMSKQDAMLPSAHGP